MECMVTTKEKLQRVLQYVNHVEALENASKELNEGANGNARRNLEAVINSTLGAHTIVPQTADSKVLAYVPDLITTKLESAVVAAKDDTEAMIDLARKDSAKGFTENYWTLAPVEIKGDDRHNAIAKAHKPVYGLGNLIKGFPTKGGSKVDSAFVSATVEYVMENVKAELEARGCTDKKAIERLADLVGESFATGPAQLIHQRAQMAHSLGVKRLGNLIPEKDRADYAAKTLKALAKEGEYEAVARGLYSLSK